MELIDDHRLEELVGIAREIAATVVAPNAEGEDAAGEWPARSMSALAESGLTGLCVPEAQGGHGQGLVGMVAVSEAIAQESPSTALCFAMHCVATAVIAAKATDHHREAFLEPIARGEHITTLALSEPGTGIHFYIPQTRLTADQDHFVVNGTKSFVTNGGHADSYVVSTVGVEDGDGEGEFSCVLVERDAPGLQWGDLWLGLGMRSNSSRTATLDGVRVPRRNLLGEEGDQLWYIFEVVAPYFLMAMAGTYCGVAGAAVEIAREHLGERRHAHTGELLGAQPVLAHRLGEIWTEAQGARQLVYSAARAADAGEQGSLLGVLACKAAAGDASVRIANEAMTLVGGMGYRENSKAARLLRDARASHVMAPTTDLLKTWVGRALVNLPLI
jgi:isovaleryl-CoA dehydrogenase